MTPDKIYKVIWRYLIVTKTGIRLFAGNLARTAAAFYRTLWILALLGHLLSPYTTDFFQLAARGSIDP
jgi:nucleoside recognition membrane protein YjiH